MPRRHEMKMENTIAAWTAEPQFSAAAPPSARRGSGTYKENTSVAKDRLLIGLGRWPKPLCCVSSLSTSTYPAGPTALVGWLPGRSWRLLVSDLRESGKEGKRERDIRSSWQEQGCGEPGTTPHQVSPSPDDLEGPGLQFPCFAGPSSFMILRSQEQYEEASINCPKHC
ncbi:hypothetical protein JHW43_007400 [Diplocarpon mali]|nr:hypothetical protein JHW43_007400 [Diplocarpon mali]